MALTDCNVVAQLGAHKGITTGKSKSETGFTTLYLRMSTGMESYILKLLGKVQCYRPTTF